MEKIDFVVTWVDGNDPAWLAERREYMPDRDDTGSSDNRFRDWDLMRYWFRGVEKFAPWVNRVYFVTWGHHPQWLNLDHPKLTLVKHTDFIPSEYLPTFNSNAIELNIHRISGLSERFVLFNDDMFPIDYIRPEDFFCQGLPCETALLGQLSALSPEDVFPHTILNNIAILNKHFSKKEVVSKHWKKFYSPKYGKDLLRNLLLSPARYFSCFNDLHMTSAYLRSSFQEVWDAEPKLLDAACRNRFRTKDDIMHWLVKWWQFCEGRFCPKASGWVKKFELGADEVPINAVRQQAYKIVCLNDSDPNLDFSATQAALQDAFETILPKKSAFEK